MNAKVIKLLPWAISHGYSVHTNYLPTARGVKVPESARVNPNLLWNLEQDPACVENDTLVSNMRFQGVRKECRVPLKAIIKWRVQ